MRYKQQIIIVLTALFMVYTAVARRSDTRARSRGAGAIRKPRDGPIEEGMCDLELSCRGEATVPIKLPIRGPRGPAGLDGEKGEPGTAGVPGLPGVPGLFAGTPSKARIKVAFSVGLMKDLGPITKDQEILWDRVFSNIGESYSIKNGRFVAPHNGTYKFDAAVAARGGQKAAVMLMHNDKMVVTIWAESIPTWSSASGGAILHLKRGDEVWCEALQRASFLSGYLYTTFSGHILFADEE
ncbi:complement C1q-like protein 3 isoform X1 [Octopus sinensis]|uniref:Complement C1q-like protein 3 isoform X1 n=1 Tax=Octopus sinensis TaxID=2607531 RepID=A0A7E6EN63_9MOLL|nr:complement C1q-like protein 3 isoform X1 [Octopus sinensis]